MGGFLFGSLVLIGLEVLLQPGSAKKAEQAGGVLTGLLRRALSPDVAGVPLKHKPSEAPAPTPPHNTRGPATPVNNAPAPTGTWV